MAASAATLGHFPAINVDEIGNCVVATHYLQTGRIVYSLLQDVVHPHFAASTGLDSLGLRAPYLILLGTWQKIFGSGYTAARAMGWIVWAITTALLFFKTRKEFGERAGFIALFLWIFSFDGLITSHLVREDIFLALFFILLPCLVINSRWEENGWGWFIAGLLGPLAFFGFHPNGLLITGAGIVLFIAQARRLPLRRKKALLFIAGGAAGAIICALLIDVESFTLGKYALSKSMYTSRFDIWIQRLHPWTFLTDTFIYFTRSSSFYLNGHPLHWDLWRASTVAVSAALGLTAVWTLITDRANVYAQTMAWLFLFTCAAIGFGAAREEFIYRLPVTLIGLALVGRFIDKTIAAFSSERRRGPVFAAAAVAALLLFSSGVAGLQAFRLTRGTPSLNNTFKGMEAIIGPVKGKILGPSYLWFWKKRQVFDVGGILIDYYYSGQKRPRECIERVRPELLVIDNEFQRRYLARRNDDNTWTAVPLSEIVRAPFRYLGTVKGSLHHSDLDVIRIDWPNN